MNDNGRPKVRWADLFGAAPGLRTQEDDDIEALAEFVRGKQAEAWRRGHADGRDYAGAGWNAAVRDPEDDNPYAS